jgi:hypothetical protein
MIEFRAPDLIFLLDSMLLAYIQMPGERLLLT